MILIHYFDELIFTPSHATENPETKAVKGPRDHEMVETTSTLVEENPTLSERDFEDITNKLENEMFKRLKDT